MQIIYHGIVVIVASVFTGKIRVGYVTRDYNDIGRNASFIKFLRRAKKRVFFFFF